MFWNKFVSVGVVEQNGDGSLTVRTALRTVGDTGTGLVMKVLQVISRDGTRLYRAMIRKQAEIRRNGRGTFLRARARKRNAARWAHVRYKGSINFGPGSSEAVEVAIQSPDHGDEARLLSSFLGWLDRHFGKQLSSIRIEYRHAATFRRHRP